MKQTPGSRGRNVVEQAPAIGLVEWFRVGQHDRVEAVLRSLKSLRVTHLRTAVSWADWAWPETGALPKRAMPGDGDVSSGFSRTAGTSAVRAPTGLTRPKPKVASRPLGPRSLAVRMMRLMTSPAGMVGQRERISAAVPETMGAAKLVPCTFQ